MFSHYLKSAWRSLLKQRILTIIHVTGLVIGIMVCLLLAAYVINELTFDRFHQNGAAIYRVNTDLVLPEQRLELSLASGKVGPGLKQDFLEIKDFTRLSKIPANLTFKKEERSFFEKNILYVDPGFFRMFGFKWVGGDVRSALKNPNSIVLTQMLSRKYFGDVNPVGKALRIDNEWHIVTGLIADPPANSHIRFDAIISYATWIKKFPYTEENWEWFPTSTYVLLNKGVSYQDFSAKLTGWLEKKRAVGQEADKILLSLQPLEKIHFSEPRRGDLEPNSREIMVWLLVAIGVIVLLLALFNYVNLATAMNAERAKEIAVLKTFGAKPRQIWFKFVTESVLLCALAAILALLLTYALLPAFSKITDINLRTQLQSSLFLTTGVFASVLIIGPVAGFYPSFVLSRLKAAVIFKNHADTGLERIALRKFLIVFQFVVSITLMVCTFIIRQQYHFMRTQKMGFVHGNKLIIRMGDIKNLAVRPEVVKRALLQLPQVQGVSLSSHVPAEHLHGVETIVKRQNGNEVKAEFELNVVDFDFVDVYGLQVVAGRKFSSAFAQDSIGALMVNETAVRELGFQKPQDIIGRKFRQWEREGEVVGVVRDFNQHSLRTRIGPVTFQVNPELFEKITIAFSGRADVLVNKVEPVWKEITGNAPFDYTILDEWLAKQYEAERRFSGVFALFSSLAIFIACMGLYGLTLVSVKRRTKEVGIRKILGASVPNIVALLSKDLLRLVGFASFIAFPMAWLAMNNWLQHFAYRIAISPWVFAAAGFAALLIALVTVSVQTVKAALSNPVKNLRNE